MWLILIDPIGIMIEYNVKVILDYQLKEERYYTLPWRFAIPSELTIYLCPNSFQLMAVIEDYLSITINHWTHLSSYSFTKSPKIVIVQNF